MEEQPKFIKEFSKQESPEERSRLAQEIREKRTNHFNEKNNIEEKEREKSEVVKQIEALRDQIESYNDASFFVKIKDFFAIKKIERELQSQCGKQSSIEDELSQSISGRQDLEETKKMVADFYLKEKKKWAELPYSKEDIAKNFTEENLASLSTEDYTALLRRFPGEMLTHVTRHGIRDHANLGNHQAGLGEYHDTLYTVLEKKNLKSALGIKLQEYSKEEAIVKFLNLNDRQSRDEALEKIEMRFVSGMKGDPNAFADKSAVHFATEEVADSFYGSERGNEIFFAFPSVLIASQYEFSGNLSVVDYNAYADSYDNDQFVWPDIERGLPIDAGIAFIPGDAKVSAKTGSKYEIDRNNRPIIIEENVTTMRNFVSSNNFQSFADKAMNILGKHKFEQKQEDLNQLHKILKEDFGIKDQSLQKSIMNYSFLRTMKYAEHDKYWQTEADREINGTLMSDEILYAKSKDSIDSKEYWENYFQQHPESRPKHIIYYSGGDPTDALNEWRQNNGILKKDGSSDMGFSEKKVSREVKNKDEAQQRFVSIARSVVDKHFPITDKNPSHGDSFRE